MKIYDAITYIGAGRHLQQTPEDLLRQMDAAGVGMAAVAAVDRYLAVDNRAGNELTNTAVRAHPDRFVAWAAANPWFGRTAEQELRRAFAAGARGLLLHPLYQGFRLSDPMVLPLLEIAGEFSAPVYAPTGMPLLAEPFQLAEWARRFPEIQFVIGHAGASDYYADAVLALTFADNIWLESSRNGPGNFQLFEARKVLHRLIFGSASPEYCPQVEIRILRETIRDQALLENIFQHTFEDLFHMGRA